MTTKGKSMKIVSVSALSLALVFCTSVSAQSQVPEQFRGSWKASWKQPAAGFVKSMEGKLVLNDAGGAWSLIGYFPNANHYPCDRLKAAVTFVSASAEEVVVKLNTSAAVNGCTDTTLQLKRIGEKNIGGKIGDVDVVFTPD